MTLINNVSLIEFKTREARLLVGRAQNQGSPTTGRESTKLGKPDYRQGEHKTREARLPVGRAQNCFSQMKHSHQKRRCVSLSGVKRREGRGSRSRSRSQSRSRSRIIYLNTSYRKAPPFPLRVRTITPTCGYQGRVVTQVSGVKRQTSTLENKDRQTDRQTYVHVHRHSDVQWLSGMSRKDLYTEK